MAASLTLPPPTHGSIYNCRMEMLLHFGVNLLTTLFFLGLAGSSVVVLLSFVEDLHELMGE